MGEWDVCAVPSDPSPTAAVGREEDPVSPCIGCSCERPAAGPTGGRLLLSTRVGHSLAAMRATLRELGAGWVERAPGMLEVTATDLTVVLRALAARLTAVEAAEVRAVRVCGEQGDTLVAAALGAPTLAQLGSRAEHADLLPLFADEATAFHSVYQPIVALDPDGSRDVVGYEALLRATGPAGRLMPTALFDAAEQAGWLHVLDRIGRTTALRGAAGWLGEAMLFVNFLPTTIYRPEVCLRTTERAAREAGVSLDRVVFEVTESERVTDTDHLARVFAYYRDRGCKVALDDLGAGYSSLNLLVELQPDVVKLDKAIVQRLPDPVSAAVVTAVVDIAHSYGGLVLAECVETAEQVAAAAGLGVDLAQGWHFGRPERKGPMADRVPSARRPADEATGWPGASSFSGADPAVALGDRSAGDSADAPASTPVLGSATLAV